MAGVFDFMKGENQVGKSGLLDSAEPNDIQSLALLQAMGPVQQAGLQRTATPVGSIAQNLLPIFGAMIYAKAAEAQAARQQQQDAKDQEAQAADIEYKKALTEKARRPDTTQNDPYKGLPGNIRARMNPDPAVKEAVQAEEDAKDRRAQFAAGLMTQKADQVARAAEARNIDRERRKPVDGVGGRYVFDSNGQRVVGANQGDVEDNGYVPLSRQDAQALGSAQVASKQLNELQRMSEELLPTYKDGLVTRAMTLGSNLSEDVKGSPEVRKFRMLSNFENLPEIQALTRRGILPQAMVKQLAKPSDLTDTRESAAAKIQAMRDMLSGVVHGMGIDPSGALEQYQSDQNGPSSAAAALKPVTPSPGKAKIPAELDVDVPAKYSAQAQKIFREVSAAHGATAGAIAVQSWLKSQPQ